jgi:hypothetical protein
MLSSDGSDHGDSNDSSRVTSVHTGIYPIVSAGARRHNSGKFLAVQWVRQVGWGLMKKLLPLLMVLMVSLAARGQESLGDAARKSRSAKRPQATVRLEGQAIVLPSTEPAVSEQEQTKRENELGPDSKATPDGKAAKSPAEQVQQKADDWKKKIDSQKQEIATLQRELDIVQREQRLRAAAYYADAGTQLRDSGRFAEESRKQQEEIDSKKQALDTANQKLADIQEQARKAGVPASSSD